MNLGVYIDFDNLIGGFKANLGINEKDGLKDFQKILIPILLRIFLQKIGIPEKIPPEGRKQILFKKIFAEYHNIPLKNLLKPEPFVFLNNIGLKPINPYIISSRAKNKNASDISLTLEVVNDLIIKKNPIDGVVIFSGDIDFYPLISWIREHTAKEVYIISFSERLNRLYFEIFKHLIDYKHIIFAEIFIITSMLDLIHNDVKKLNLKDKEIEILINQRENVKDWIHQTIEKLASKDLEIAKFKKASLLKEFEKKLESFIDSIDKAMHSKKIKDIEENDCFKFKLNLINGLKNWLKKKEKASTGLIIKNWFPKWGLSLSESEANECLKQLIESGELEKEGFIFHGDIKEGIPIGEFKNP